MLMSVRFSDGDIKTRQKRQSVVSTASKDARHKAVRGLFKQCQF